MNKETRNIILSIAFGVFIIGLSLNYSSGQGLRATLFSNDNERAEEYQLMDCLKDNGVVIYGSRTCPACSALVDAYGGSEAVSGIYVECTTDRERCASEKFTDFVPEIQVEGEPYEGSRELSALANAVGCDL